MTDENQNPAPPSATPMLSESDKDSFLIYKKDPRIENFIQQKPMTPDNKAMSALTKIVLETKDEEACLNELRLYKKEQHERIIATLETSPFENRAKILNELSLVAFDILNAACAFVKKNMPPSYGMPSFLSSCKQIEKAHLAIVAMGKLGAREINYQSDLDLIFIYSNRGETTGPKIIDNSEYFVKFSQRLINALSIMTGAGRCYEIDTELRPSGNAGTLVTSYDHFLDHQMNRSQNWERQALLRANPNSEDQTFARLIANQIEKLVFTRLLPEGFTREMHQIRERVIHEKSREIKTIIDLKYGSGSLMDVEFILHHIQLRYGPMYPDLRMSSLFELLSQLKKHTLLNDTDLEMLTRAHLYFRTLESQLQLVKKRSEFLLDTQSEIFEEISERLGYPSPQDLQQDIMELKRAVRDIYLKFYLA